MPRASAEARSAAAWRVGARHPEPPKHLSKEAAGIWREIVECRAVDFFEPGSLHLLETFCTHTVHLRRTAELLDREAPGTDEYADLIAVSTKLSTSVAQLAQKLRLSIQAAVHVKSRKTEERAPAINPLLGGHAAQLPKMN